MLTRKQKLDYIKSNFPSLYANLYISIPGLVTYPEKAKKKDIIFYNKKIYDYLNLFFDDLAKKLSF